MPRRTINPALRGGEFSAPLFFFILALLLLFQTACGSASGAPPVSIPAPSPSNIRITSPNEDGLVTVTGSNGAVSANAIVRITNLTTSGGSNLVKFQVVSTVETTADANGAFSTQIVASATDTLRIIVIDPTTREESDSLDTTIPSNSPPLRFSPQAITVDGNGSAYVVGTLNGAGILSIIAMSNNTVMATIDLNTPEPRAITFDSTGNELLIADSTNNRILIVEVANTNNQRTVDVTSPCAIAVDRVSNRAIIGSLDETRSVSVMDLTTETVIGTAAITHAENGNANHESSCAVDAQNGQAVIASQFDDASSQVTLKDLENLVFTGRHVINNSRMTGIAFSDGSTAWTTDSQNDRVWVVDLSGNTNPASIDTGDSPQAIAIDQTNNRAYIANNGSHTVSIINTSSSSLENTTSAGINPISIDFSANDGIAVANSGDNSVSILE